MVAPAINHRETLRHDLLRALARAKAERLVVFRRDADTLGVAVATDGALAVKPYVPAIVGTEPGEVVCSCPAGAKGATCKHLAAALFARKHGVYAVKPAEAPTKSAHDLLMECYE